MKTITIGIIILPLLISCNQKSKQPEKIAARIDNTEIRLSEIDNYVRYEIFEALQRIYILRKAATEELINDKLFELEATHLQISKEKFLQEQVYNKIADSSVNRYVQDHKLDSSGMPDITNGYRIIFPNTPEGRILARDVFKKQLLNDLSDGLKRKYNIQFLLTPPQAPTFDIANIPVIHYRGNLQSRIVFLVISDFACSNCRANYAELERMINKYDKKIKFAFTHFSSHATLASVCSEAAGLQGKFWEYYHKVFTAANLKDDDEGGFIDLAKNVGLDIEKFKKDISGDSLKQLVATNIEAIKSRRIYATPTFVLNGKVILEIHNITEIEKMIDAEIEKQ